MSLESQSAHLFQGDLRGLKLLGRLEVTLGLNNIAKSEMSHATTIVGLGVVGVPLQCEAAVSQCLTVLEDV